MFDKYPMLGAAIAKGWVYLEGYEVVGIASDGVEVSIACDINPLPQAERYLTARPTPDLW